MKGKGEVKKENSKSMPTIGNGVGPRSGEVLVPAFAKLQGEYFEYYMRKYSIILGRYSKKKNSIVDLDLRSIAWGTGISRNHARIYYDFTCKCFALEVIGRFGCIINNALYLPSSVPIKLKSQDLLQIGNVRFYFLLPSRSFFETLGVARQIAPPLLTPLMVVQPTASNDKRKGKESLGIGRAVPGLIVVESNAREAEGSCAVLPGVSEVAGLIAPPLLPPLPVVPPSMNVRMGEEREGNRKRSLGVGLCEGGVSGLVVEEFNASKAEGSSGMLSDTLAARQIMPPLLPPLVVVPPASSNDEGKGEERKGDREESVGVKLREGGASGLIAEEFKAGKTEASSDVLSGGIEQSSLSNKKREPRSNDVHVVKIDLPGIKKEHIKLVVEDGKIWIQISEDAIENENISMCHCVEDDNSKFILPENAKINEIKASMENGMLTVTVPMGHIDKSDQPEVKSVEISG